MFKKLRKRFAPNALQRCIKGASKCGKRRFLLAWNRGLGDIALGIYAIVHKIQEQIPDAHITCLTRKDLVDGFRLIKGVDVLLAKEWARGSAEDIDKALEGHGLSRKDFDVILEKPDPTQWVRSQIGSLVPKLSWDSVWDEAWRKFGLDSSKRYVGVHVQTETRYPYEKNWLVKKWTSLFERLYQEHGIHAILFGFQPTHSFSLPGIVDLRGKTALFDMLSIIKNRAQYLVVPDSGVLSLTYFLDVSFPLRIVSLWSDPNQGVLKQNVVSPNPQLEHIPLIGKENNISHIEVEEVIEALLRP